MSRVFLFAILFALSACAPATAPRLGQDGKLMPQIYRISSADAAKIQFRMLDAVNALRSARGMDALSLDSRLNAAAATHSRDMSVQGRPWHFGSDGSSPLERVQRAGFPGAMRGENISETYETELQTLAAWVERPETRDVLLDAKATHMGLAYFQEINGKIWWTLITGRKAPANQGPTG